VERTLQQFGLTRSRPRRQTGAVAAPPAPNAEVHDLDALASPPMEALAPAPREQRAEAR